VKLLKLLLDIQNGEGIYGLPRLADYLRMTGCPNKASKVDGVCVHIAVTNPDVFEQEKIKEGLIQSLFPKLRLPSATRLRARLETIKHRRTVQELLRTLATLLLIQIFLTALGVGVILGMCIWK
jgi:hypothetical protein